MIKKYFFIFCVSLIFSCSSKTFDTKQELWTYLKEESNGYLQSKNINGYDFSLLYKPTDLLVEQELGSETNWPFSFWLLASG